MFKKIAIVVLFLCFGKTYGQEISEAWNMLLNNKMQQASEKFDLITNGKDTELQTQAYVGKFFLAYGEDNHDAMWRCFKAIAELPRDNDAILYTLFDLLDFKFYSEEQAQLLKKMSENANSSYDLRRKALAKIDQFAAINRDYKTLINNQVLEGFIFPWQLLGPFENYAGSGFDKYNLPLQHPENDFEFEAVDKMKVKWFNTLAERHYSAIDFNDHFDFGNYVYFAQTFCNAAQEGEASLAYGHVGNIKIWINDVLVHQNQEEKNNSNVECINKLKVRFNKGYNRILIQIGISEYRAPKVDVIVAKADGSFGNDYTFTNTPQPYTKDNTPYNASLLPFASHEEIIKQASDKQNIMAQLLAFVSNYKLYNIEEGTKQMEFLESKFNSSYLLQFLKLLILDRNDDEQGRRAAVENLKRFCTDCYFTMISDLDDAFDKKNNTEAFAMLENIETKFPHKKPLTQYYSKKSDIQNDKTIYNAAVKEAFLKDPTDPSALTDYTSVLVDDNRKKEAKQLLEKFHKKYHYWSIVNELEYLDFDKEALMLDNWNSNPSDAGELTSLSNYYKNKKKWDKAEFYAGKILEIAPYKIDGIEILADIYNEKNDKTKALEWYKKIMDMDPRNFSARERIRNLENKPDPFDYFGKIDLEKIYKNEVKKDINYDVYEGYDRIILYSEEQRVVFPKGSQLLREYVLFKILNQTGIDNFKEMNTEGLSKAIIIKKDGKVTTPERSYYSTIFTNLEVGDVIGLEYSFQQSWQGNYNNDYWTTLNLTNVYPTLRNNVKLLIDKSYNCKLEYNKKNISPKTATFENYNVYEWNDLSSNGIKYEVGMPLGRDYLDNVIFSSISSWDNVSKWYWNISNPKVIPTFEVKNLAKQILKESNAKTETEKAKAIYNWIAQNVRYSSVPFRQNGIIPQSPKKVLSEKIGDCKDVSTLYVSLSREMGLDANLVLVRTVDLGKSEFSLPNNEFNHCIAKVKADGKLYNLELTGNDSPFGAISNLLFGAKALDIRNDRTCDLFEIGANPNVSNNIYRETKISFDADKAIIAQMNMKTGSQAAYMRAIYKDLDKKLQQKTILESISKSYDLATIDSLYFYPNLKNLSDTVSYFLKMKVYNSIKDIGGVELISLSYTDEMPNDFTIQNQRNFDLLMYNYLYCIDDQIEKIEIKIPDNKKLIKIPQNQNFSSRFVDYDLKFNYSGNVLKIDRKLLVKPTIISQNDYNELKTQLDKVIKVDKIEFAIQ